MSRPNVFKSQCGQDHPVTDVYCEHKHTLLVTYPIPLVVGLILGGLVAFMLVGFFGYSKVGLFTKPWPLFLWLCALMLTLQISILRRTPRHQLIATLVLSLLSIALVAAVDLGGKQLAQWIEQQFGGGQIFSRILQWLTNLPTFSETYVVVNYGLIGILALDSIYRWVSRARGRKPVPILAGTVSARAGPDDPQLQELIAGDLIVGGLFLAGLSLSFRESFLQWITGNQYVVTNLLGSPHSTFADLSTTDGVLADICLPIGLIALFVSTLLVGLNLIPDSTVSPSAFDRVARAAIGIARGAAFRRIPIGIALLLSPRLVLWPILIFVTTFSLASYSQLEQEFLHGTTSLPGLIGANLLLLLAMLAVSVAMALQLFSDRVLYNTLRLISWVVQILLPTFWIAALALLLFNQLFLIVPNVFPQGWAYGLHSGCAWVNLSPVTTASCVQPFAVSWVSLASLIFAVVVAGILLVRRFRSQAVVGSAVKRRPA